MAHFAQLDSNNKVTQVIVIANEDAPDEATGKSFIADTLKLDGTWVQTSYNASIRGKCAGVGDTWDGTNFVAPVLETE